MGPSASAVQRSVLRSVSLPRPLPLPCPFPFFPLFPQICTLAMVPCASPVPGAWPLRCSCEVRQRQALRCTNRGHCHSCIWNLIRTGMCSSRSRARETDTPGFRSRSPCSCVTAVSRSASRSLESGQFQNLSSVPCSGQMLHQWQLAF